MKSPAINSSLAVRLRCWGLILCLALLPKLAAAAGVADIRAVDLLLANGHHEQAEREYNRILDEGVDEFLIGDVLTDGVHYSRGLARIAQGKYELAMDDVKATLDPESSMSYEESGYSLRALVKLNRGDRAGALTDYAKVIELAASGLASGMRSGYAFAQRGHAYLFLGDYAAARKDYERAIATDGVLMGLDYLRLQKPFWTGLVGEVLPALEADDQLRAQEALNALLTRMHLLEKARITGADGIETADSAAAKAILVNEMQGPLLPLRKRLDGEVVAANSARAASLLGDAQQAMLQGDRRLAFDRFVLAYRQAPDRETRHQSIQGLAALLPGLPARPDVPEAVRRLLVKAQVLAEEKDYEGAVIIYWQAISEVPWFAQLHHDRAVLIAQVAENQSRADNGNLRDVVARYDAAIEEMQRYLILAPQDKNARASQDLVYQWEIKRERVGQRAQAADLAPRARGVSATAAGNPDCFIATAAYGSYLDPHVHALREFRDRRLLPHAAGRWLVATYYRHSPPLADFIRQHDSLRWLARLALTPVVAVVAQPALTITLALGVLLAGGLVLGWFFRGAWRAGRGARPA